MKKFVGNNLFRQDKSYDVFPRIQCETNADCPAMTHLSCDKSIIDSNYYACNYTVNFRCANLSDVEHGIIYSECVPITCNNSCSGSPCENGCLNGECIESNFTDLIVYQVINVSNTISEKVNLTISIKNQGTFLAPPTVTKIFVEETGNSIPITTPEIEPGEVVMLQTVNYIQPRGTTYHLKISADADEEVEELNENNNDFNQIIIMPA